MNVLVKRGAAMALLTMLVAVPGLRALGSCADYISTKSSTEPLTGYLLGQRSVTLTTTSTMSGGINTKIAGSTYTRTVTMTTSYDVGVYVMSDGTTREVRCDNYRQLG